MNPYLAWIPGLPLLAFFVLILFGKRLGRLSAWLCVLSLSGAGFITASLWPYIKRGVYLSLEWDWLAGDASKWRMGLAVDGMSYIMLVIVTLIGTMIAIYSIGYMKGDNRFSRYFAYFSLFCASMLGLVMADHFLLLYACWELVGLCSYLLISFWFEKPAAAIAGRKAFITTRIGDTGLLLGILLLALTSGNLSFDSLESVRLSYILKGQEGLLGIISSLIFLGAVGKSAQIPLHVWLPDAMEGPTPVSALIHAATMVAAGVYLAARTFDLFTPASLAFVLAIGLTTHIVAATIALTMTDIKRILAYSTISQLGLMMSAVGLGAMSLAMFHLMVHAFCKALLFLCAGSVIHATHQQELSLLGGLRDKMPLTWACFFAAAFSLGGFPLASGFWSKDAILVQAQHSMPWVFWLLLAGSVMTASYLLRLGLVCFHARPSSHSSHAHESGPVMVIPMCFLALGAVFAGLSGSPFTKNAFFGLIEHAHSEEGISVFMIVLSGAIVALSLYLAWTVGLKKNNLLPKYLRPCAAVLYKMAHDKYYFDEAYERFIIRPLTGASALLSKFDAKIIDAAVDRAGRAGAWVSHIKDLFDRIVVDGIVNGIALSLKSCAVTGRRLQSGIISNYLFVAVGSIILISLIYRWY